MRDELREKLSKDHVLRAIERLASGADHTFGESTFYDLIHDGKRYPPKAVFGLAATNALGRQVGPEEFSSGKGSWMFTLLEKLGFTIIPKQGAFPDSFATYSGRVWMEITSLEHGHGGHGWELGRCLWSPSEDSAGNKRYAIMQEPAPDEVVVHSVDSKIVGISRVAAACKQVQTQPPQAGNWAGRPSYFRIELSDYTEFVSPIEVSAFIQVNLDLIRSEAEKLGRYPFAKYRDGARHVQGGYLTECSQALYKAVIASSNPKEKKDVTTNLPAQSRIWAIGAGEGGRLWNDFQEGGVVAIGMGTLGDLRNFSSRDEISEALTAQRDEGAASPRNDTLACQEFCADMQVGDLVVAKVGRQKLLGVGRIVSEYRFEEARPEYRHVRSVKWLAAKDVLLPETALLPTKTLTDVTDYKEVVQVVYDNYFLDTSDLKGTPAPAFVVESELANIFLPREEFLDIVDLLRRKKNIVLQGPPGVGKTFVARTIAYALFGEKDPKRVEMVQFHQSYSYEDFVQGWRPNSSGGFQLRPGVFYNFCNDARNDSGRDYVFVIDEINRGNLSKIFGELLMLIEADKRGASHSIPLTYSENNGERFSVPPNLHVIGLMNTADRSLAMVDYALRRRFAFKTLLPQFSSDAFKEFLLSNGVDDSIVNKIVSRMNHLNALIQADVRNLGPGYVMGHSYFCPQTNAPRGERWYRDVLEHEILPLLQEYWFDRPSKWKEEFEKLIA